MFSEFPSKVFCSLLADQTHSTTATYRVVGGIKTHRMLDLGHCPSNMAIIIMLTHHYDELYMLLYCIHYNIQSIGVDGCESVNFQNDRVTGFLWIALRFLFYILCTHV